MKDCSWPYDSDARLTRLRYLLWAGWTCVSTLAFGRPLAALFVVVSNHELLSYIPLVFPIAVGLVYTRRESLPSRDLKNPSSPGPMVLLGSIAAAAVAFALFIRNRLSANDYLALTTFAYVCVVLAGGFVFTGAKWMVAAAFPSAFLFFLVPLPDALVHTIENALVFGSAEMSGLLFRLTGTPLVREGTVFVLPGVTLEVARECSGINSSWTLFIVSLVASNLFLKTTWSRAAVVAFVAPLAVFRNSVRILTVGLLCVHVGPYMIDSYIHRSGGPIFFALSLIPLFLMLLWLRRLER